jgi:hypothetical protein
MRKKPIPDPGYGGQKAPDLGSGTLLIYNKKPDLIKEELGGQVVLLGERGDGEGAALLQPLVHLSGQVVQVVVRHQLTCTATTLRSHSYNTVLQ